VFPVEIAAGAFTLGRRKVLCGIVRDITERRRMERKIAEIESHERMKVGRDMHDTLSQQLVGIRLLAESLHRRLEEQGIPLAGDTSQIVKLIGNTIDQSRRIIRGLAPTGVSDDGLVPCLVAMADDTESLFKIPCRCIAADGVEVLDPGATMQLFRIAQEAVSNAVRHAKAGHITISLSADRGSGQLTVQDDGKGLPKRMQSEGGMGLQIMRYRSNIIGGELTVEAGTEGGTKVTCSFPLHGPGPA
jgi:signal transduction histidine kinase